MSTLLLAESGSTKTDWCLIQKNKKPLQFKTSGINPYLQSEDDILSLLKNELNLPKKTVIDRIAFYGAGAGSDVKRKELTRALKKRFDTKKIDVESDLIAAARSLCGANKGIVCILGTGSNSCYYNGSQIKEKQASLGFIAGDEGSGNHMGKRVLQYYAYNTFDTELHLYFEQQFGKDLPAILHKIYREPFPNRYLAGFTKLLIENRGHFMVENIIEDCLNDFFHHHILKYRQSWKLPIYFTGSIADAFKDVIEDICNQYELELGTISKSPIDGLIKYHKQAN